MSLETQGTDRRALSRRNFLLGTAATGILVACHADSAPRVEKNTYIADLLLPQHLYPSLRIAEYARPGPVEAAKNFILSHQTENSYIVTNSTKREIVPMDTAHAAIALSKVGHGEEAKNGVNWLLEKIAPPDTKKERVLIGGKIEEVAYGGSLWDQYKENGKSSPVAERGRGEGIGLLLMAIDSIAQLDETYMLSTVGGVTVADQMEHMTNYLSSLQQATGAFIHRPNYKHAFYEENIRMAEGLRLTAERLTKIPGKQETVHKAKKMSDQAFHAVDAGTGLEYGMSYDYLARAMWGRGGRSMAVKEIANAKAHGRLNDTGVHAYDMKQDTSPFFSKEKLSGLSYGTSETAEGAIALFMAGEISSAQEMERNLLSLQQPDGGFPSTFFGGIGMGDASVYTAARVIQLERVVTDVMRIKGQPFLVSQK